MTEIDAYQEYIRCKHNAFCKAVIRYAAIGKIIRLRQKWEREIPLDYLTNEKFIQFAEPEPDEEHPPYRLRSDRPIEQRLPCQRDPCFAGAGTGRNPALLFSASVAARDRRVYWPVTQHSRAAYPDCLAETAGGNGEIPP